MGGSWTKTAHQRQDGNKEFNHGRGAHVAADSTPPVTEQPQEGLLAAGCGRIAEYLALAPWSEKWEGLRATQPEIERHLHLQNSTCVMLEELPEEAILTAESKILQQLHSILQHSRLLGWPMGCLHPEISTPDFDGVISEIAEFETLRLGFLIMIKETLLAIYDKLTNLPTFELANQPPQLTHLLDMNPALTWFQFVLPEELTHPTFNVTAGHSPGNFGLPWRNG